MRRRSIEEKVVFLDVFTMISLLIGQAKHSFLEKRVFFIPQCHGHTKMLLVIAKAPQAVFVPAISPATGMIVWEIVPGVTGRAVILAHRTPRALTKVRTP